MPTRTLATFPRARQHVIPYVCTHACARARAQALLYAPARLRCFAPTLLTRRALNLVWLANPGPYIGMAYIVMTFIVMAYIVMAYIANAFIGMA